MAYDKIIPIRHRLDHCVDYALNEEKTGLGHALDYGADPAKARLVTGINCGPGSAYRDMQATKRRWDKKGGIGGWCYHICEFAERMEQTGARYAPLDYIRDMEFYRKYFFAASEAGSGPAYYIIDETQAHGFAVAPAGAGKGMKYCVFEQVQDGYRSRPGNVVAWGGTLQEIRPQDWGFDLAKIKAVTQRPKKHTGHKR